MSIKLKYNNNRRSEFEPCPEFSGAAKIVDYTNLKEYTDEYGTKEKFRYILEIDQIKQPSGNNWTVSTKPFTLSLHQMSGLRKFVDSVNGKTTSEEGEFNAEQLVGKYCNVVVEHFITDDHKIYANIKYSGKLTDKNKKWESSYIRLKDREETAPAIVPGGDSAEK